MTGAALAAPRRMLLAGGTALTLSLATAAPATGQELVPILEVEEEGIAIVLEIPSEGEWCQEELLLRWQMRALGAFASGAAAQIMGVLGPQFEEPCPALQRLRIEAATEAGEPVYSGISLLASDWALSPDPTAPLAAETPPPEDAPSPAAPQSGLRAGLEALRDPDAAEAAPPEDGTIEALEALLPAGPPAGALTVSGLTLPDPRFETLRVEQAREVEIAVEGTGCVLRHTGPHLSSLRGLTARAQSVGCRSGALHGNGLVRLYDRNGTQVRLLSGAFSHGWFTGAKRHDAPFISRSSDKGGETLTTYHASEPVLSAHLLTRLSASNGRYDACLTPAVEILVENDRATADEATRAALLARGTAALEAVCPGASEGLIWIATDLMDIEDITPTRLEDDGRLLALLMRRGREGWQPDETAPQSLDYHARREEMLARAIAKALRTCETAFDNGVHAEVENACTADLLADNDEAAAVIARSQAREDRRATALAQCLEVPQEAGFAQVLEHCATDMLKGVEEAETRAEAARAEQRAFERRVAERDDHYRGLIAAHERRERDWERVKERYDALIEIPFKELLHNYFGVQFFDIPQASVARSLLSGDAGDREVFFVEVVSVAAGQAEVGWPYPMMIEDGEGEIATPGWYAVSGSVRAAPELPARDGLVPARLKLSRASDCLQPQCGELTDPLQMIRDSEGWPDWSPDAPPEAADFVAETHAAFPDLADHPLQAEN